jgi:cell division ATPase FtsA
MLNVGTSPDIKQWWFGILLFTSVIATVMLLSFVIATAVKFTYFQIKEAEAKEKETVESVVGIKRY